MSPVVHRKFEQLGNGSWQEELRSDNGSEMNIKCGTHHCKAPELLGPYHFHGVFVDKKGDYETFFGSEGGDYPAHLLAALELDDGG